MTELLTRPPITVVDDVEEAVPSLWWRGALGALWAICLGAAVLVVLVLIVWATDARSGASAGDAMQSALQLWLLAHKVPLHIAAPHGQPGATVAIAPLGLTLAFVLLVARAGAVLARGSRIRDLHGVATVAAAVGVPYGVLAAFVAAAAHGGAVRPSPVAALGTGLLLGTAAAAWGALRAAGRESGVRAIVPPRLHAPIAAGAVALPVLMGAGLVLVLGSLAVHAHTAGQLADSLGSGVVATGGLLLLDALLLPNAALAAVGYITGPGFAIGAATSYSQTGVTSTALPSLPLLAAAPQGPAPTLVRVLCLLAMAAAGVAVGWRLRRFPAAGWTVVRDLAGAGAVAGAMTALAVGLAGGPAGPGRMAVVGASPWQVGLVTAGEVTAIAALVVAISARKAR
ncbi:MAG: hypothetical protein JO079_09610 [Frankiaceae bacterium]|nr:hypothetical protein [Frankiaceae bacterium]MBV9369045.1 hypothetical protein [Frankiales bacterium]